MSKKLLSIIIIIISIIIFFVFVGNGKNNNSKNNINSISNITEPGNVVYDEEEQKYVVYDSNGLVTKELNKESEEMLELYKDDPYFDANPLN